MFIFELKKFMINKRNVIMFLALSFVLLFTLYFSVFKTGLSRSIFLQQAETATQTMLATDTQSLTSHKLNEEEIAFQKENIQLLSQQIKALENKNINQYFDLQLQLDKKLSKLSLDNGLGITSDILKRNAVEISYLSLVKSRKLSFEIMPTVQFNAFGQFVDFTLESNYFTTLFLLLFSFLVSTTVAFYMENKEIMTYKFLNISSRRSLCSKILSAVTATFLGILLLSFIDVIIVGLKNGFGSWDYPAYLVNIWNNPASDPTLPDNMAISVGSVIVLSMLYLFVVLLFLATLGAVIAVIFKRSMVVIGIMALIILGWVSIASFSEIQMIKRYLPFSYLNPVELLCQPKYLFGNLSYFVGFIYLVFLSLISFGLAVFLLKNQKIRRI
ncbi:MAG: hypothetical protein ACI31W_07415 [Lactococcus sp.]